MAKFTAKRIDMALELTTLDGEEITKEPQIKISAFEADRMFHFFNEYETANDEKELTDRDSKILVVAKEIAEVYGESPEWWMQNFDFATLNDIILFIGQSLAGLKKTIEN